MIAAVISRSYKKYCPDLNREAGEATGKWKAVVEVQKVQEELRLEVINPALQQAPGAQCNKKN